MIEDLPQRMRELGRLRMGEKAIGANGKPYPVKRTTWRFTSQSADMLGVLADLYGGTVEDWPEAPGQGTFYQLKTDANSVDVLIPIRHSLSQFYEFWTADGCTRRCTGKVNLIDDTPCVCPSEISDRMAAASGVRPTACKPTTRLNVMLPDVPDLGYWRLEAHGYQAAIEIPGALAQYVGLARMYAGSGADLDDLIVRAELAIEARRVKKPGQPPSDFVVPVIRTPQVTPTMLMSGTAPSLASVREIAAPSPPAPALPAASASASDEPDDDEPDDDEMADDFDKIALTNRIAKLDEEHKAIARQRWAAVPLPRPDSGMTKEQIEQAQSLLFQVETEATAACADRRKRAETAMKAVGVTTADGRADLVRTLDAAADMKRLTPEQFEAVMAACDALATADETGEKAS